MSLSIQRRPEIRKTQWCWTYFLQLSPRDDEFTQHIANKVSHPDTSVYVVYQREVCPDTGRVHLQGFVCFKVRHTLSAVKRLFRCDEIHVEPARYTEAAIDYCLKAESRQFPEQEPRTYGLRTDVPIMPMVGGTRSDLAIVAAAIVSGESVRSVALRQPEIFVRNCRGLAALHEHVAQPSCAEFHPKTVFWFYGPTGTGKTRRAVAEALDLTDPSKIYFKTPGPWWDGMNDPEVVIMDDFRASWFPFSQLLNFLDGYQISVPVKGSFTMLRPKFIYITSAKHPEELYCALEERTEGSVAQLLRRITQIIKIGEDQVYSPFAAIFSAGGGRPTTPLLLSEDRPGYTSSPLPVPVLSDDQMIENVQSHKRKILEMTDSELSLQLDDCCQSSSP